MATKQDMDFAIFQEELAIFIFESKHHVLLKTHKGFFIAMHYGEIIDQDKDELALVKRVHANPMYKDTFVLIRQVTENIKESAAHLDSPEPAATEIETSILSQKFLHWELIYSRSDLKGVNVFRAKIAGGWLVLLKHFDSEKKEIANITFVPDTMHIWSGLEDSSYEYGFLQDD